MNKSRLLGVVCVCALSLIFTSSHASLVIAPNENADNGKHNVWDDNYAGVFTLGPHVRSDGITEGIDYGEAG